jgi:hypothetical protein
VEKRRAVLELGFFFLVGWERGGENHSANIFFSSLFSTFNQINAPTPQPSITTTDPTPQPSVIPAKNQNHHHPRALWLLFICPLYTPSPLDSLLRLQYSYLYPRTSRVNKRLQLLYISGYIHIHAGFSHISVFTRSRIFSSEVSLTFTRGLDFHTWIGISASIGTGIGIAA